MLKSLCRLQPHQTDLKFLFHPQLLPAIQGRADGHLKLLLQRTHFPGIQRHPYLDSRLLSLHQTDFRATVHCSHRYHQYQRFPHCPSSNLLASRFQSPGYLPPYLRPNQRFSPLHRPKFLHLLLTILSFLRILCHRLRFPNL
uniref:Uncharacterized protein n=1 Tax=Opuntia streptacantha TaxID=393608 RepID=A0A7C9APQ8_OPUST